MRVVVILFLSLFFQILGARDAAFVSNHANKTAFTQLADTGFIQQLETSKQHHHFLFTSNNTLPEKDSYQVSIEDDDEEDCIKKHSISVRYFLAFYYAFISAHSDKSLATKFSNCRPSLNSVYPKYITQRVLRI